MNPPTPSLYPRVSAGFAALGVTLGAFGAHGLEETFREVGEKAAHWWETAVFYHLVHAVALFALASSASFRIGPWRCLLFGTLVFSGTLYVMAVTEITALGAVTPVGGLLIIAGWIWLAVGRKSVLALDAGELTTEAEPKEKEAEGDE